MTNVLHGVPPESSYIQRLRAELAEWKPAATHASPGGRRQHIREGDAMTMLVGLSLWFVLSLAVGLIAGRLIETPDDWDPIL